MGGVTSGVITFSLAPADLVQLALMLGGFIWGYATLNARVRAVEAHGEKIDQIAPLQASLTALEKSVGIEFKNMRDDLRDLASSVRDLASARRP